MRHRTITMLALTLVLALAAGTALMAQDTTTATGRITNVDTSSGMVTVTTPDEVSTFVILPVEVVVSWAMSAVPAASARTSVRASIVIVLCRMS